MKRIFIIFSILLVTGCGASEALTARTDKNKILEITCSMLKTEFIVGEELSPPTVTFHNDTDRDIKLIGPTITVIECTLVPPDKTKVRMCIAMPTGLDPRKMPHRILSAGTKIDFTARGIWYYTDKEGFIPYVFSQTGIYEFSCQYEGLTSSIIKLVIKEKMPEQKDRPNR
ncbi:MAG: hypothetical protein WAX69_10575 [Victivallales bacterium]